MSGRNQHSIPQSLLRGFSIGACRAKNAKVWVFRRGQMPKGPTSTKGVAVGRDFYSRPSPDRAETLDDRISDYEGGRFTQLLFALRRLPSDCPVDVGEAAELVAHLTARNAHLRATFRSTVETLIAEAGSIFAGEANFRLLFGDNAVTPTPRVRELINRAIPLRPLRALTGLPEPLLSEIVFTLLRENFDKLKQNAGEPFAAEVLVQCPIVALSACLTCRRCQRIEMGPDSRTDFSIQLVVRA